MKATRKTIIVTERVRLEFTDADVRKALRLPPNSTVFVRVPGGGDWSNTDLDVTTDTPIVAEWTMEKTK